MFIDGVGESHLEALETRLGFSPMPETARTPHSVLADPLLSRLNAAISISTVYVQQDWYRHHKNRPTIVEMKRAVSHPLARSKIQGCGLRSLDLDLRRQSKGYEPSDCSK